MAERADARRVNYDQIAPTYNRRFQKDETRPGRRPIDQTLSDLVYRGAGRVLEAGCGTGRWLAGLHDSLAAGPPGLFGLDFSAGMLHQAQERELPLQLVRGQAEWLPYPAGAFDLVYCVNAIHHFGRPEQFIHEARRVLRPGGGLAVIGSDPRMRGLDSWYVYQYFPGTYETDLARFPSWGQVLDWMAGAGFKAARWELAERIHDPRTGREVFEDPFLEKNATSQLVLLSEEAYQAGLARIRAALEAAETSGETLTFRSDILIYSLYGTVPGE